MAEPNKSGKREIMTTLVVVLLLTLVGACAGFALGTLLAPAEKLESSQPASEVASGTADEHKSAGASEEGTEKKPAEPGEPPETPEAEEDAQVPEQDLKIVPFPAVLTTLAEPRGKWIRVEGSIVAVGGGEKTPEMLAEESGEHILAYLRTVRLAQLEGASGIHSLRDDLNETVRTLSEGEVRGVLIHGLVVE